MCWSPRAWFNRAALRAARKDYHGAIRDYSRAIALVHDYPFAWYGRANARRKLKDYEGAAEDYDQAVRLNPSHAGAWTNRALTYESWAMRDRDRAEDLLKKAEAGLLRALEIGGPDWSYRTRAEGPEAG